MADADEGMSDLYGGETPDTKGKGETVDQQEQEEMQHQAAVPLKVLMGKHTEPLKAGDEVVLKVDKIDGDMAMVSYSETPPGEIGKEGKEGDEPPTEMSADDELEQLGKMY